MNYFYVTIQMLLLSQIHRRYECMYCSFSWFNWPVQTLQMGLK